MTQTSRIILNITVIIVLGIGTSACHLIRDNGFTGIGHSKSWHPDPSWFCDDIRTSTPVVIWDPQEFDLITMLQGRYYSNARELLGSHGGPRRTNEYGEYQTWILKDPTTGKLSELALLMEHENPFMEQAFSLLSLIYKDIIFIYERIMTGRIQLRDADKAIFVERLVKSWDNLDVLFENISNNRRVLDVSIKQ